VVRGSWFVVLPSNQSLLTPTTNLYMHSRRCRRSPLPSFVVVVVVVVVVAVVVRRIVVVVTVSIAAAVVVLTVVVVAQCGDIVLWPFFHGMVSYSGRIKLNLQRCRGGVTRKNHPFLFTLNCNFMMATKHRQKLTCTFVVDGDSLRSNVMALSAWDRFWMRFEAFFIITTSCVFSPLPTGLRFADSHAEAVEDLDKRSIVQKTRPSPRIGHARMFLKIYGWHLLAITSLSCIVALRQGLFTGIAVAISLSVSLTVCLISARVYSLRELLDYSVLPALQPEFTSDEALLDSAWSTEVGQLYRNTRVVLPKGGYCGFSVISWVFRTIPGVESKLIRYPRYRHFLTFDQAVTLLSALGGIGDPSLNIPTWPGGESAIASVERIGNEKAGMSYDEFKDALNSLNNPRVRLLVMFAPAVLWAKKRPTSWVDKVFRLCGVHWSVVVNYLPEKDLVLIGDPNKSRPNGYLVPARMLFRFANTPDVVGNSRNGLLRVNLA